MATHPGACKRCCAEGFALCLRVCARAAWTDDSLKALENVSWGMLGVCAQAPKSGPRQAVWKSMLVHNGHARGYAHYISMLSCTLARRYARGYAHHIYIYMS